MFKLISPNMLKTFETCPKKFCFKYVDSISMPVNDEIFSFGKNIHALASYFLRGENIEKMEKSLTQKEFEVWSYLKGVKYFKYDVINTEYTLTVKIGEYFFSGRLDALVKDGENYYILDYKTGSPPKEAKYDYQTMIYILAVKNFFKTENVTFVYLDLKNREEVCIKYSAELEKEYIQKLTQTAKKLNHTDKSINKKESCICEYSKICL